MRIVRGNNSLKDLIATSRGSPMELDVFRTLPESPESAIGARYEMTILNYSQQSHF